MNLHPLSSGEPVLPGIPTKEVSMLFLAYYNFSCATLIPSTKFLVSQWQVSLFIFAAFTAPFVRCISYKI